MTYVALALALVLLLTVSMFAGLVRSLLRAHARERDLMLNKLLHSVGRPWVPAPADEAKVGQAPEERTWTWSPEQWPTDDFVNDEIGVV